MVAVPPAVVAALVVAVLAANGTAAAAKTLPSPTGEIILTVSGNIEHTNGEGVAEFDRAMLEGLGLREVTTSTAWTEGRSTFEGVSAEAVMDFVGARGDEARAVALNDYHVEIPLSDFHDYPVILALKMDGRYMRVRNKGPIWIVYPVDQYSELDRPDIQHRWIWQLRHLEVR